MRMRYQLEDLQDLYGRAPTAVSRNARPLRVEKLRGKWRPIMEDAISFTRNSFAKDGIPLSVRQVHYHLTHAGLGYENDTKHTKKLTTYMLQARIARLIEWRMIAEEESTVSHYYPAGADPEEAIRQALETAQNAVGENPWDALEKYPLIISEKRELGPQLAVIAGDYYARLVCTRGYGMWSRLYREWRLLREATKRGCEGYLLFVTDHDPSGLDINRFGAAVLKIFWDHPSIDKRVMLTIDQVEEHGLTPAPAKVTDPRAKWYTQVFGYESWEVDALGKEGMQAILQKSLEELIDHDIWDPIEEQNAANVARTEELAQEHLKKFEEGS